MQIIRAALMADADVSADERARVIAFLRSPPRPACEQSAPKIPRLIRRAEAAQRLSCSTRTVDKLSVNGLLRKCKLPGRVRAAGFRESDIEALILGNGTME